MVVVPQRHGHRARSQRGAQVPRGLCHRRLRAEDLRRGHIALTAEARRVTLKPEKLDFGNCAGIDQRLGNRQLSGRQIIGLRSLLAFDPHFRQFLLALRALADSQDGIAAAALFREPFFALDLADLVRAKAADEGQGDEGIERARAAQALIQELRRRRFDRPPGETARDLLERTPCPAIVDARGPELVAALSCRPLLVKPNREELARTVGRPLAGKSDLRAAMESLRERGAAWVLVTDGAKPAILLGPSGCFHVVPPRPERVINPIGCGDCLAAGIADQIARGREPLEAIRFGMACASFNCGTLLAGRLDRSAVDRLSGSVEVARIAVVGGKT